MPDDGLTPPCYNQKQTSIESVLMDTQETAQAYLCLMMALRLLVTN